MLLIISVTLRSLKMECLLSGSTEAVVQIENLPCSRNHSFCEGNVILARSLELGRVYDLKVRLRDTRGDTTTIQCTIRPTNSSTPIDTIFPHLPTLIVVPEVGYLLDLYYTLNSGPGTR